MTDHTLRRVLPTLDLTELTRSSARSLKALLRRARAARDYHHLARLPDHLLDDIGISRAMLETGRRETSLFRALLRSLAAVAPVLTAKSRTGTSGRMHRLGAIRRHRILLLRAIGIGFVLATVFTVPAYSFADWQWVAIDLLGAAMLIAAVIGRFWAILHVGGRKSSEIVRSGPYSLCRHPLYLFSIIGIAGLCIMGGSLLIGTVIAAAAVFLRTMADEEADLAARFPEAYCAYKMTVPRLLPRPSRHSEGAPLTVNTGALFGNFRDALVFLLAIPVSEGLEVLNEAALIASVAVL